jgi:DNA excision repair protein ERCC-3
MHLSNVDKSLLEEFLKEPYVVIPKKANEWYVIAPKWLSFAVGWLERSTRSYNIFIVNRYVQWFSDVPLALKEKLKFTAPSPVKVFDGMLLTGKELQEKTMEQYRPYILRREGEDRLRIKQGYEFQLIAQLIENGTLPFMPLPVKEEDLRPFSGITLRPYQEEAWRRFLETGAIGIFWTFGTGKSLFSIYALARIKGPKLVVVPSLTLLEQTNERIKKYVPQLAPEITVVTYHAYDKVKRNSYSLIIFDECHHLPANTFVKLSTLKAKYRMGLSASPFREDGREAYIIALTGFPVGISWDELIKMQVVKTPTFKVYLVKDTRSKLIKLEELLRIPVKTIIFSDSLDMGEQISKKFEIPFVYGDTRDRLDIITKSLTSVVSRVGDEGVSLPDIERVIEVSFLFGSRMQESQRFGRLMHSLKEEPEHIIIMTEEEYEAYGKRLNAIYERGFKVQIVR